MILALLATLLVPAPVLAQSITGTWAAGPTAIGDSTVDGYIDTPAAGGNVTTSTIEVSGWVVDKSAQGWSGVDEVHVYAGLAGAGGTFLGKATIGQSRPDVASAFGNPYWASAGYKLSVSTALLARGSVTITVYAHTSRGWWYKQSPVNVTAVVAGTSGATTGQSDADLILVILRPQTGEVAHSNTTYSITGYALDKRTASQTSGIEKVEAYIGTRESGAYLGTADLSLPATDALQYGVKFGNTAGWILRFEPTKFTSGQVHTLTVYAKSSVTGQERKVSVDFRVEDPA
jgi:hypothetical protein